MASAMIHIALWVASLLFVLWIGWWLGVGILISVPSKVVKVLIVAGYIALVIGLGFVSHGYGLIYPALLVIIIATWQRLARRNSADSRL